MCVVVKCEDGNPAMATRTMKSRESWRRRRPHEDMGRAARSWPSPPRGLRPWCGGESLARDGGTAGARGGAGDARSARPSHVAVEGLRTGSTPRVCVPAAHHLVAWR
jgi:hypothetical protein